MQVRPATTSDLAAIDRIYNAAINRQQTADRQPYSPEQRKYWFNDHAFPYSVFVVEVQHTIAGWISFSPYRKGRAAFEQVAEISYYLADDFQGRGIGTELLEWAKLEARQNQFHSLVAILQGSNLASRRVLEKAGFECWGTLPNLANFDGVRQDHLYYGWHRNI